MGRSTYSQSVSTSTRTFQTTAPSSKASVAPPPSLVSKCATAVRSFVTRRLSWLVIATLVLVSLFLFVQYREAQAKLSPNSSAAKTKEVKATIAQVSKLAVVPTNEIPTVVTVADATKLKGQSFFVNAKTGDKVVVYTRAKQAILYRPSTDQIVNMAPVNSGTQ